MEITQVRSLHGLEWNGMEWSGLEWGGVTHAVCHGIGNGCGDAFGDGDCHALVDTLSTASCRPFR